MPKSHIRIHDVSRRRRQEVVEVLQDALEEAKRNRSDGLIFILTSPGQPPIVKSAGSMNNDRDALWHMLRMSAVFVLDDTGLG